MEIHLDRDPNMTRYLAQEMPFAKVVCTAEGEGLLIGNMVFAIQGPNGNAASLFANALRNSVDRTTTSSAGQHPNTIPSLKAQMARGAQAKSLVD